MAVKRLDETEELVRQLQEEYAVGFGMLDDYDHQRLERPEALEEAPGGAYVLTYDECRRVIGGMRFAAESPLFGNEKDDSFKSSLGAVYQTFGGAEVYPGVQEKAANLLYLVVKNHSFSDGNKRIAAMLFLYFLAKNSLLFRGDGALLIDGDTLAAVTLLAAMSKPQDKEAVTALIVNLLTPEYLRRDKYRGGREEIGSRR